MSRTLREAKHIVLLAYQLYRELAVSALSLLPKRTDGEWL